LLEKVETFTLYIKNQLNLDLVMKVKISDKIICIPPYVSTTWDQVSFLQSEKNEESKKYTLSLHLRDGKVLAIPELDASIVDIAFSAHTQHLEKMAATQKKEEALKSPQAFLSPFLGDQIAAFPIRLGMGSGMEGLETAFQHNPAQANAPNLPKELIDKIAAIARIISNGDMNGFPKPEPHCNCMHCQVARSLHQLPEQESDEENVSEADLTFRSWEIAQSGEKLFLVTNPIDPKEQYSVYLGTPVGCTCGQAHCEHIRAVLSS
jgi:hypothetical protein